MTTKPRIRADLKFVEVDGEVVIYDETSEDLHHLNSTASIVFTMLDGSVTIRDLAQNISETFQIAAQEVEPQIRELVKQFRGAGLLVDGGAAR